MTATPAPGTPEWAKLMTASKVAAVLGLSPWESPRSMWHKMRGEVPSDDGSNAAAKARGHYLENGILAWWGDRHADGRNFREQDYRARDGWAASTPDAWVADDGFGNVAVVDAKTANDDHDWGEPGTDQVPAYYAAQAMWQMWTHDAQVAYIAVLFGSPRLGFEEYVLERDEALIAAIVDRCREFYDSLSADEPPPLDDSVATYDAIRKLHPDIDREASVELTEGETLAFTISKHQLETWDAEHRAAKSVVLDRMGSARVALFNGQVIARRQPNRNGVSLVAVAKLPESENVA